MAIGDYIPTIETGGVMTVLFFFAILIAIIIIVSIGTYIIIMLIVYNKKIIVFEKIAGSIQVTLRAKAREIRLDSGDTYFYVQKLRRPIPTPTIQTGSRVFWLYKREDGELINFGIEDIDAVQKLAKAHFLDKEMRYARGQLQRNFGERYKKIKFWDKYGGLIMYTMLIAITGIMVYLLFDKWIELSGAVGGQITALGGYVEKVDQLIISMENVCSGGAGIAPAG